MINRWPFAMPNSVAMANIDGTDYLFVGDGEVISVYDTSLNLVNRFDVKISDDSDLDKKGEVAGTEGITGVACSGSYLYVTCGNEGLQIFDVSVPLNVGTPESVYIPKETTGRGTATGVAVMGNYAYIVYYLLTKDGFDSGIQVIDVTDKTKPTFVEEALLPATFADIKKARAITLADINGQDYAFVADEYNGLVVFDIRDPADPKVDATCYFPYAYDVEVAEMPAGSGDYYAYVADDFAGLRIVKIDLTKLGDGYDTDSPDILYPDPEHDIIPTCQYLGGLTGATSVALDTADKIAFVGDRKYGLVAIDISDITKIDTTQDGVSDNIDNYVEYYNTGMTSVYAVCVDTSGNDHSVAYVADTIKGFQRVDVTINSRDPLSLTWNVTYVDDTSTPADVDAMFIDPDTNYTFTVDDDASAGSYKEGLRIFFTVFSEDYISFLLKGKIATDGEATDVYYDNGYVYVADGSNGLVVIDPGLQDKDNTKYKVSPSIKGTCAVTGTAVKVVVSGNYAYVAAKDGGLSIVDISDPADPTVAGAIAGTDISDARSVRVSGNYAYVADGANGLKVVNISDKSDPVLAGSTALDGTAMDLSIAGTRAYVAAGSGGFHVVDISDPTAPERFSGYAQPPYDNDVKGIYAAISDADSSYTLIWVSAGENGLAFFSHPPGVGPQYIAGADSYGDAKQTAVFGDYAFIADSADGLLATMVNTQSGQTDSWDWLSGVVPTNLHQVIYTSEGAGCMVECIDGREKHSVWGIFKNMFDKVQKLVEPWL